MLLLSNRMLKNMRFFPNCFATTAENEKKSNAWVISVFSFWWQMLAKNWPVFGSILHLPRCYLLKNMFFPLFCNSNYWKEKMQRLGHKCFFLKVAMLLTNVGKKGESLVLYCACHTTTFEEDNVEKKHVFSHCFATTANCNAWVRSICHFDVGKTIGESLVPYFTCHTTTFATTR